MILVLNILILCNPHAWDLLFCNLYTVTMKKWLNSWHVVCRTMRKGNCACTYQSKRAWVRISFMPEFFSQRKSSFLKQINVKLLKIQCTLIFCWKTWKQYFSIGQNSIWLSRIFAFKFSGRRHLGFHDVIRLLNCFTQKNVYWITIAAAVTRHKIQNGGNRKFTEKRK